MPLNLTPVTPGAVTITSAPAAASTKVVCRESLKCSANLKCGEFGVAIGPVAAGSLTITPSAPS